MLGDQLVTYPADPAMNRVHALAVRWRRRGVGEPPGVQLRIACTGLGEGQPIPRPEISLYQSIVDAQWHAQRVGYGLRSLPRPQHRRADDRGNIAGAGQPSSGRRSLALTQLG